MSMWMMRRGSSAKLGGEVPQAAGERAEQRGSEVRAGLDEREERGAADRLQRRIDLGGDVGDALRRRIDQRYFAEHATGAEALDDAPSDRDAHAAFDHRVHAHAFLAFGDDAGALLVEDRRII